MKAGWKNVAERIDAMTLRERALMFAAVVALVIFPVYTLLVAPEFGAQKNALTRIHRDQSQVDAARREIERLVKAGDVEASFAEDLAKLRALQARIAAADGAIAAKRKRLVPPERVPELLRDVVARNVPLKLVSLDLAAGGPVSAVTPPAPGAKPVAGAQEGALYRHGVEIALRGDYFGVLNYVKDLERLPWSLIWGDMQLEVQAHPEILLRLKLYTLSDDRAPIGL